jgi:hypothetical protein
MLMPVYFKYLIVLYGETDKNYKLIIVQYCDLIPGIVSFDI